MLVRKGGSIYKYIHFLCSALYISLILIEIYDACVFTIHSTIHIDFVMFCS